MPIDNNMFVGRKKKNNRKKYSETISKCLKSRHVYMECMKHTKRKKKRPNSPLCHPVGQQTGPRTERGAGAWSLTVALTSLQVWS